MVTTIYSKPLTYGGRNFLIYNTVTKRYHIGNTASTAVSHHHNDIQIEDVTTRQLKEIAKQLENRQGFKEHRINWDKDFDTYGDIRKNLLTQE